MGYRSPETSLLNQLLEILLQPPAGLDRNQIAAMVERGSSRRSEDAGFAAFSCLFSIFGRMGRSHACAREERRFN